MKHQISILSQFFNSEIQKNFYPKYKEDAKKERKLREEASEKERAKTTLAQGNLMKTKRHKERSIFARALQDTCLSFSVGLHHVTLVRFPLRKDMLLLTLVVHTYIHTYIHTFCSSGAGARLGPFPHALLRTSPSRKGFRRAVQSVASRERLIV